MRTVNFSDARSNLKDVFDTVVEDADVTIITRRDAGDVVVMSLDSFNSWRETMYLMSSPANARRLNESIAQARRGRTVARPLARLDDPVVGQVNEPRATYAVKRSKAPRQAAGKRKRR